MSKDKSVTSLVRKNKKAFVIMAIVLAVVELQIFAVSAMKSGRKSHLQIMDANGNVIHITDGDNLSDFNKYYFEKTFGPLEQYEVKLVSEANPFPFRAYIVAAVGIPIGIILLFAFVVKAYMALFYGEQKKEDTDDSTLGDYQGRLEKVLARVSRFNIFTIGFLLFLAVFLYWVVPNSLTYIGKIGIETLIRFKWVFLGVVGLIVVVALWLIYLRYRLAKQTIESQVEVEKYRIKVGVERYGSSFLQLENAQKNQKDTPLVAWDQTNSQSSAGEPPRSGDKTTQNN
jgi:hypothetical protein